MIYDPHELTEGQIIEVIEDAGFEADIIRQSSERQQPSLQVCRDPACHFSRAIFRWTRSRKVFQLYALYPKIKHFLPTNITKTDECARSPTFHTDTPEFQKIDTASLLPTELEYLRPMASTGRSFSRNPGSVSKLNKPKGGEASPSTRLLLLASGGKDYRPGYALLVMLECRRKGATKYTWGRNCCGITHHGAS